MSREDGRDELLDLLAERATTGLDRAGAARLEELLAETEEGAGHFELAAAALELVALELEAPGAAPGAEEAPPAAVTQRLRREGRRFAAGLPPSSTVQPRELSGASRRLEQARARQAAAAKARVWVPWLVAATFFLAACAGWWRVLVLSQAAAPPIPVAGPVTVPPAPGVARAALLAGQNKAAQLPFAATADPAAQGVSGDVVWSPARQEGYLRFAGLPANDPQTQQYQLWIFDATRDDRFPVDGGVFDVPASGEVVIPIQPRLPVGKATLFAITIEKPGGVVVSSRERLVLVAKVI